MQILIGVFSNCWVPIPNTVGVDFQVFCLVLIPNKPQGADA